MHFKSPVIGASLHVQAVTHVYGQSLQFPLCGTAASQVGHNGVPDQMRIGLFACDPARQGHNHHMVRCKAQQSWKRSTIWQGPIKTQRKGGGDVQSKVVSSCGK